MLTVCFVWLGTYEGIQCMGQAIRKQNKEIKLCTLCVLMIKNKQPNLSFSNFSVNIVYYRYVYVTGLALLRLRFGRIGVTV